MQSKTTRAFRTISEAGEELDLQPHVLRFWESKFPQIKPMKRGGGRRFYRPEDIEFLRGIKILLHDEKHPIKDVQKLIRMKGAERVLELGRSVERAATPKPIEDTVLIPARIVNAPPPERPEADADEAPVNTGCASGLRSDILRPIGQPAAPVDTSLHGVPLKPVSVAEPEILDLSNIDLTEPTSEPIPTAATQPAGLASDDRETLTDALERLKKLRSRWDKFQTDAPTPSGD